MTTLELPPRSHPISGQALRSLHPALALRGRGGRRTHPGGNFGRHTVVAQHMAHVA